MGVGSAMNKERVLLFAATAVVLGLSIVLVVSGLRHAKGVPTGTIPESQPSVQEMKSIEYRVGRVIRRHVRTNLMK